MQIGASGHSAAHVPMYLCRMSGTPILDRVNLPNDLKLLGPQERILLCDELRTFLRKTTQEKEGHITSSIGVTELTVALHTAYDTPTDILIWDVGHQAYIHKILTGRKNAFHTNRQLGGLSGFPVMAESPYDAFGVGHSATSIAALGGMATALMLQGIQKKLVAVIGDGALTGGLAFEALNHLSTLPIDLVVVLNDNQQSIDPNIGALHQNGSYAAFFESLGWMYHGPENGHDVNRLTAILSDVRMRKGHHVVHIRTQKPQSIATPTPLAQAPEEPTSVPLQTIFANALIALAKTDARITAISPAMLSGCSLDLFQKAFPDRTFDVGIAEQHAVTFAAGQAAAGLRPFVNLYSTFAQRAIDQIIHDVALQNLPVTLCLERAGLVGEDGPTHHGAFDLSLLQGIPNLVISAPGNAIELRNLLQTALHHNGPFVIRYPKAQVTRANWPPIASMPIGKGVVVQEGTGTVALLVTGCYAAMAARLGKELPELGVYHFPFVKPLDAELLQEIGKRHQKIVTLEDGAVSGGFGAMVRQTGWLDGHTIHHLGLPDSFVPHGTIPQLQAQLQLNEAAVMHFLQGIIKG
jgi:1-deoxy-D-xylulose-5-phosphate synthase